MVVSNLNGEALLPAALTIYDPLSFGNISPQVGFTTGGESLRIQGSGFIDPSLATLGERPAVSTNLSLDGSAMTITSPGAAGEGLVDLSISNDTGVLNAPSVFTFIDPSRDDPRIISLWPSAGPIEGGKPNTHRGCRPRRRLSPFDSMGKPPHAASYRTTNLNA